MASHLFRKFIVSRKFTEFKAHELASLSICPPPTEQMDTNPHLQPGFFLLLPSTGHRRQQVQATPCHTHTGTSRARQCPYSLWPDRHHPLIGCVLEFYSVWFGYCLQFNVEPLLPPPVTEEGSETEPPPVSFASHQGCTCTDLPLAPENLLHRCDSPLFLSALSGSPQELTSSPTVQSARVSHSSEKNVSRTSPLPCSPRSPLPSALNSSSLCPCLSS